MEGVKMGAGGLVVPKSKPEGAASVFAITEAVKRLERERAIHILAACRSYEATSLFPFIIQDGVAGIEAGLRHYGQLDRSANLLVYLGVEIRLIEEKFK